MVAWRRVTASVLFVAVAGCSSSGDDSAPVASPDPEPITSATASDSLDVDDTAPTVSETSTAPTTQPVETEPPRTAPTAVSAVFVGGELVLSGEVLDDEQLATLDDAAVERFGADQVTNEIQTSEAEPATPGADDRVAALAALITAAGDGIEGAAELSDSGLVFVGTSPDDETAAALESAVESTADFFFEVTLVLPPTVEEETVSLQTELDALAGEINETVEFASDSAELTEAGRATLDKAIAVIQEFELPVVQIVGHTDDEGSEEANQDLSTRRAAAVADYIVASGIAPERIRSEGRGELEPIADNATEDGRQLNRRVELTALAEFES